MTRQRPDSNVCLLLQPRIQSYLSSWIILYLVTRIHRSAHILKDTHAQAYGVPVALACFTLKAESAFFRL